MSALKSVTSSNVIKKHKQTGVKNRESKHSVSELKLLLNK